MNPTARGILLLAATTISARAEIVLTDLQDRKATVEIVRASPTEITVVIGGRQSPLKLDQLSEASRGAALDYARSKGVFDAFPTVRAQLKIGYQHRSANFYEKNVTLKASLLLAGANKMEALPSAEASLVIITHDTEEKYKNHVDKLKIYATETIEIPAGPGARREFPFAPIKMTFDTARDPSNIGGDEYRYFIFGLRDPATKQLIDFQTNSTKVQAYVAKHPEAREALLAARQGAPFTDEITAAK